MFTPPPSPSPVSTFVVSSVDMVPTRTPGHVPNAEKRRTGRRMRWAVFIIPSIVILITASTRYLTHPAAFDIFSATKNPLWQDFSSRSIDWTLHRRHPTPQAQQTDIPPTGTPTNSNAASMTLAVSDQPLPTVPSSPPILPTPFPQPFDTSLQQNFSSVDCFNFFTNMTNSESFRSCRPFSLLLQSSSAFAEVRSCNICFLPVSDLFERHNPISR